MRNSISSWILVLTSKFYFLNCCRFDICLSFGNSYHNDKTKVRIIWLLRYTHFTIHARNLYLAVLPVWASNWSCLSIPMATQRWSVQHFAAAAAVVVIGTVGSLCFVFVATSVPAETDLKSQRKKKVEEYVVTLKKKGFKGADEVIVLAYVDPLWLI